MSSARSRAGTLPLVAGRPVLDLVNTRSWRGDPVRSQDHLQSADDCLLWCVRAGVLTAAEARRLQRVDTRAALLDLRALVEGALLEPDEPDLDRLRPVLLEALAHSRLVPVGPGVHGWRVASLDAQTPARRLALDLYDLLTTPHGRLGTCADPACGWVFLDTSRAQNRQWCNPADCGNRERVRRHHERVVRGR